ncbi:MAG TPA: amidohydrolase, partial [Candidatus Cloacimonadota bacterium]|nr:amidohydrolase [Candidatus Cloacimonadota bacterium]
DWKPRWILGGGWNRNVLSDPMALDKSILDHIFPDIPVALFSKDYHSKLCSSKALSIAGITGNTLDPVGGRIERDITGEPTGVLFETAAETLDRFIVPAPQSIIVRAVQEAVEDMYLNGLAGFHTMENQVSKDILLAAQSQGSRFRFCWHFQTTDLDSVIETGKCSYTGDEWYKLGGLKLFTDGSLGSRTAAMYEDYTGEPGNKGILRYTDDELYALAEMAAQHGLSTTIHAIGDRAVKQVIQMITKLNLHPQYKYLSHRIEHVQSIRLADIDKLKQTGMLASLQPVHLANDVPMIEAFWSDIKEEVYPFKSLIHAGIPYAFGSDAPIETMNPFAGIYTALERKQGLSRDAVTWRPQERIPVDVAISGYTMGSALASCSQDVLGSIDKGKYADLIILEDFRELPSSYWLEAHSLFTMVGGKVVYSSL